MEHPVFLLLIAEVIENQIIKTIPLTFMTEDEAKYSANSYFEDYLSTYCKELVDGRYIAIVVRKSYYDTLSKKDVTNIFLDDNVYISSKEINITGGQINVL